ncbi:MAG: reverse transcriptase family protein [Syntrophales bacterium]|nr:reverse transcriptase family protein [Syntrophales bacterium]
MLSAGAPNFPLRFSLNSCRDLSITIGYPLKAIEYFGNSKDSNVKELRLKQIKDGRIKVRKVYNPSPQYKKILRAINKKLQSRIDFPKGVLGGVIGKSISDMAKVHCNQEAVLSIDLKDFFPSITSGRVIKLFRLSGCSPLVAGLLTDLVTLNGSLPQGFPTSPMIANLIAFALDVQHLEQCDKNNINRTRWIDDIVFSGRTRDLVINTNILIGAIKPHGFQLNNKKTAYKVRSNHPVITGLDVRGKAPNVPIIFIDRIREILIECKNSGVEVVQAAYESGSFGKKKDLKSSLFGRIQYIAKYNMQSGEELMDIYNSIDWELRETPY